MMAIVLLLCCIYRASKQGLIATLVNLAGYFVALAVAWPLSRYISAQLFSYGLRAGLVESVAQRLAENGETLELLDTAAQVLDGLPEYVASLLHMDPDAVQRLADALGGTAEAGAQAIVDGVLAPVVTGALAVLLFVLLFPLLLWVVRLITRLFRAANNIPIVGPLNSVLGGVTGLLVGIISLFVWALILQFIVLLTGGSLLFLNNEVLASTVTYRLLRHVDLLGLLTAA